MDILLLVAKEIIFRWKVVKTANRKELATAKKELEDRKTKWEVTPSRKGMSVARKAFAFAVVDRGSSSRRCMCMARGGIYFERVYDECEYRWFCSGSVD